MLGFGALGEFPLGGGPYGFVAPTNMTWFSPLSEPRRFKRAPRAAVSLNNQSFAFNPLPVVSFSWFEPISEPVRRKKLGLPRHQQQSITLHPDPVVSFSWFNELSKPATLAKRGLRSSLQQFTTKDTEVIPVSRLIGWYSSLSEPRRFKRGLRASLQQFLAAPSRLIPTPGVTGILDAIETKDTFLAGVSIFNRPVDGEIGVQVLERVGELSVSQPAAVSARMSIRIAT